MWHGLRATEVESKVSGETMIASHYTQVVWRDTAALGCGSATCPSGALFVVCSYDPPGNVVGQLPY
ncbi:hypothetical protein MPTK1_6g06560 [Marchantia polymorpha subsp. ruderalis]|uniref:SCP domain-containing protein n=2 Tax=Marchantia polymorpha TaxID=3197 RepID=A0AAF6BP75_MARPO|nr:hypothetical protein MARPO_0351s0001 [Marchantia polymorpha]BBN13809.1 hypothetical protein Mp_6g06560 [Marchantia polymorpha subsp. ruderalis]|eukprot:PTQ26804.1 hypothetical protein MARPO_0351s0001 [Marchantia polymorpha]